MRFFTKAVEMYENGLARFPQSFDLAYNKLVILLLRFCASATLQWSPLHLSLSDTLIERVCNTRL